MAAGCSQATITAPECAKTNSVRVLPAGSSLAASLPQQHGGVGGFIDVSTRSDPLASVNSKGNKRCTASLDFKPVGTGTAAYLNTAEHCIDPSLDESIVLKLYQNANPARYLEIPITIPLVELAKSVRAASADLPEADRRNLMKAFARGAVAAGATGSAASASAGPSSQNLLPSARAVKFCQDLTNQSRQGRPAGAGRQLVCASFLDLARYRISTGGDMDPGQRTSWESAQASFGAVRSGVSSLLGMNLVTALLSWGLPVPPNTLLPPLPEIAGKTVGSVNVDGVLDAWLSGLESATDLRGATPLSALTTADFPACPDEPGALDADAPRHCAQEGAQAFAALRERTALARTLVTGVDPAALEGALIYGWNNLSAMPGSLYRMHSNYAFQSTGDAAREWESTPPTTLACAR